MKSNILRSRIAGFIVLVCLIGLAWTSNFASAQPAVPPDLQTLPEGVRWDRIGKRFIYSVLQENGTIEEIAYTPETGTEPRVTSKLRFDGVAFDYSYKVKNHKSAVVGIDMFSLRTPPLSVMDYPVLPKSDYTAYQPGSAQHWAIFDAWRAKTTSYQKRITSQSNADWRDEMRVDIKTQRAAFYWRGKLDTVKDHKTLLMPGQTLKTISIVRPELPGALLMQVSGWTPDFDNAPRLPTTGPAAAHAAVQVSNRFQEVAVLGPAIILPTPYNGAELMRRVSAHAGGWAVQGLAKQDASERLQTALAGYISALSGTSKSAVRNGAQAVLYEAFLANPGMHHGKIDADDDDVDDDNASIQIGPVPLNPIGNEPAIHRVAVRALAFNVIYALVRAEISMR